MDAWVMINAGWYNNSESDSVMFFDSWGDLWRVLIMGACAYVALILILRLSGKRTLAKMSAFDFIVTVALGSILASILLSPEVALVDGLAALLVLVLLQYLIAALSARWRWVARLAKSDATVLLLDGVIDEGAGMRERVTREEVVSAVRSAGFGQLDEIAVVVLETDGRLSVVSKARAGTRSALPDATRSKP